MSTLFQINNDYKEWISNITVNFKRSQIKAATMVNSEMLKLYYRIGKGLSQLSKQYKYGSSFYKTVSADLKERLPNVKSFSPTNLKYMRAFYETYKDYEILPQFGDGYQSNSNRPQVGDKSKINSNRQQLVDESKGVQNLPEAVEDFKENANRPQVVDESKNNINRQQLADDLKLIFNIYMNNEIVIIIKILCT